MQPNSCYHGISILYIYMAEVLPGRNQGGVLGCPWPPLLQPLFNQTTYNRLRKCHDDILTIVTIWCVPSLWHSVTPPLENPGYAPVSFACSHIRLCVLICRDWSKHINVAKENPEERTKVIEPCSPSETDKNVIRHEMRYKKTQKKIRNCHNNT